VRSPPWPPSPHTLGLVTNISGNLAERALVALEAEIKRREHLFNQYNVSDIAKYQELYWQKQGQGMEPLPRVVIIVDEFAELVTDYPEFMDGLVRVARVGRSLGIHLILATQSPRGKVSQQIWANSRFRICLRVEDAAESQDMLHRPDAAYLPRMPGRGYLQVGDNEVFELFQVARVAGTYRTAGDTDTLVGVPTERIVIQEITATGQRRKLYDSKDLLPQQKKGSSQTDMEVVVQHLAATAARMGLKKLPSPWPEPLPAHIPLPDLLQREGYAGWNGQGWWFEAVPPTPDAPFLQPLRESTASGRPVLLRLWTAGSRPLPPLPETGPAVGPFLSVLRQASGPAAWHPTATPPPHVAQPSLAGGPDRPPG
jgi:S-DNA-T family DNA segregation ATPase FtsK/SpoIIIE